MLETAILGLLTETPLHGYELRKRLNLVLGSFRALSYGSVYPALKAMVTRGLIVGTESTSVPPTPSRASGRGSSTSSPPRARSTCRPSSRRPAPRPGRTRAST
ncbi:PadR family transcriptional regulator [Paraoerskovia sediminicola]|uniref:PadR family transcriptional regulator n=1 Tax=Paraoerskovia sediminicola TaxID=1138587 RepID=UPI003D9BDFA3